MRKQYNGLDLLKFVMALIVVMIHVKPNGHSELLSHVFQPLQSISVPVFFVISSVLLFNKLNRGGFRCSKIYKENRNTLFVLVAN